MLTLEQQQAIKAAILANSEWNAQPDNSEGAYNLSVIFNADADPAFYVWNPQHVSMETILANGFLWDRLDNIDAAKARVWQAFVDLGYIIGAKANMRAGVLAAWPLAANANQRTGIFQHLQRKASVVEKMFTTGAGTTTNDQGVGPGALVYVGPISPTEVENARRML